MILLLIIPTIPELCSIKQDNRLRLLDVEHLQFLIALARLVNGAKCWDL